MAQQAFNAAVIALYRLFRGGAFRGKTLLLETRGRKTGKSRTTPLYYVRDGDAYAVIGSYGGSPTMPAWYLNITAEPEVQVEVGSRRFHARAEVVGEADRARLWPLFTKLYSGYQGYVQRTDRVFPIVRLQPG